VAFRIGSRLFSGCKNTVSGGLPRCKSLMSGKKVMKPSAVCVPLPPGDEQVSRACHGMGRKKRGGKTQGARKAREPQIIRQGALSPEAAPQWPIAPKVNGLPQAAGAALLG